MKKLLISLMAAMMSFSIANAFTVALQVEIIDPEDNQDNPQRGPVLVPDVSLDSHTLYLYNVGYDLTLVLLDEDDEVAYTAFIPANTASVVLPATLSGEYEMQLYPGGDYYFYGWIEL